ncbi:hypothetical protein BCR32DRAFT_278275 [Anaeromyces robustus]|uniref:Uncharacterized protein n=1 Tax=Anaeromyces robustus TaxID=1754192 RepID=A0A1Y1XBS5_9FUNG|nr:hypothetical protein BCR32DRAFT_278275 [Anaeromyces robustus]|eukprot:ORX83187.1 hypothetical protein BCR32DRAFT_278275 [Anaeromyces robustus]
MKLQIKDGFKNGILPFLVMAASMGILMSIFMGFRNVNKTQVHQVAEVAGEETNPTISRLIWCIVGFILGIVLIIISEIVYIRDNKVKDDYNLTNTDNFNKDGNNDKNNSKLKLMNTWTIAVTSGIIIWQSIGECLWHYGVEVKNDEGDRSFANFSRIESIQGIPFFIILALIFFYGYGKLGFGVESCLGSFLSNWYGHICMIGTYPIALACGVKMEMSSWYRLVGIINTIFFLFIGLYLIFTKKSKPIKYLASCSLYAAIGIVIFGVILGET